MKSTEFVGLEAKIKSLKDTMLLDTSPSCNNEEQQDRIRGYILLSHAAFETYVEDIANGVLDKALNDLKTSKVVSPVLLAIVCYFKLYWPPTDSVCEQCCIGRWLKFVRPRKSVVIEKKDFITNMHALAFQYKSYIVSKNNGIKEKDIKNIFVPLGLDLKDLDNDFLADLNSFGALRGSLAHNSINKVTYLLDASDIRRTIETLLFKFEQFDELIMKL